MNCMLFVHTSSHFISKGFNLGSSISILRKNFKFLFYILLTLEIYEVGTEIDIKHSARHSIYYC
jgi:hypothetical protein